MRKWRSSSSRSTLRYFSQEMPSRMNRWTCEDGTVAMMAPFHEWSFTLHRFVNRRDPLPSADAHRCQSKACLARFHGLDEGRRDSCSAGAERMADGDGAAPDIHLLRIGFQQLDYGQCLGGEGLVDLDQVHVFKLQAGAFEGLVRGWDRTDAHDRGIDAGHGHGPDAHLGFEPKLPGPL